MPTNGWELLRDFAERGTAEAFCAHLRFHRVPARIESQALGNAIEVRFKVFVPTSLAHRARWLALESAFSEGELGFLATGKLLGHDGL